MYFETLIDIASFKANAANIKTFDCRFDLMDKHSGRAQYDEGHLPDAVYADLEEILSADKTDSSGRHPLPTKERFVSFLQKHGVNQSTQLVAYDASGGLFAARFWWMCRWIGHPHVAILEKGVERWVESGETLSTQIVDPPVVPGDLVINPSLESTVDVTAMEAIVNQSNKERLIVDVRAEERFKGLVEPIDPVAGHIPGAINIPLGLSYDEGGSFLSPDQLKSLFRSHLGDYSPKAPVFMCGSGVTACLSRFAIELAQLPPVTVYPGSWSEWISHDQRPVETAH